MQTDKEIRIRLKEVKKNLKATEKRYEEYDNYEDMEAIPIIEKEMETLLWVLGEKYEAIK